MCEYSPAAHGGGPFMRTLSLTTPPSRPETMGSMVVFRPAICHGATTELSDPWLSQRSSTQTRSHQHTLSTGQHSPWARIPGPLKLEFAKGFDPSGVKGDIAWSVPPSERPGWVDTKE